MKEALYWEGFENRIKNDCDNFNSVASERINDYFNNLTEYYKKGDGLRFGPSDEVYLLKLLRILNGKVLVEIREILKHFCEIFLKHEMLKREFSICSDNLSDAMNRISALEKEVDHQKSELKKSLLSMQIKEEHFHAEIDVLKNKWEADNAKKNHEIFQRFLLRHNQDDKERMCKIETQRKLEIGSMRFALESQKNEEIELLKSKLNLQYKLMTERNAAQTFFEIKHNNNNIAQSTQTSAVGELKYEIQQLSNKLRRKDLEIEKKTKETADAYRDCNERENLLKAAYEEQLNVERRINDRLRKELNPFFK